MPQILRRRTLNPKPSGMVPLGNFRLKKGRQELLKLNELITANSSNSQPSISGTIRPLTPPFTLSIKIAQKPYIIGSLGPEALKYESFEGKG